MTGIEFIDNVLIAIAANLVTYQLTANGLFGWAYQTIKTRLKDVVQRVNGTEPMRQRIVDLEVANSEAIEQRDEALSRAEEADRRAEEADRRVETLENLLEVKGTLSQAHIAYLEEQNKQLRLNHGRL